MNDHTETRRSATPTRMSAFSSRVAGVDPAPAQRGPFTREMERPRTESYGELWRRANTRLRGY